QPAGSEAPLRRHISEKKTANSGPEPPFHSLYVRKNPNRDSLRLTKSKFLPRCQNPQFCGFVPRGKLVGECLPQTLLCGLRRLSPPRSCGKKGGHDHAKEIQNTPPQPRCENPAVRR